MKRRPAVLSLLALLLPVAIPIEAKADVNHIVPVTPRAMAMAGAYSAISDDPSALYFNPAGLVRIDGSYTALMFLFSFPNLGATGPMGRVNIHTPRDDGYGLHLAWNPKLFEGNLGLGFSIFLPHQRALRFNVHRFDDPYFVLFENSIDVIEIRLGAAYKFFDLFSIGASMLLLAGLDGRVTLEAPFQGCTPDQQTRMCDPPLDQSKRTVLALDATLPNRQFFTAGAQFYPSKKLTLAVSYREPTYVPITLPIDFTIEILQIMPIQTVASVDVKVKYSPPQLTFGVAYQALSDLLISLDLVYGLYSQYEVPYGNVTLVKKRGLDIELLPPRRPDMRLRDVLVPRLGVEWKAMDQVVLRGGYAFLRSFIESSDAPIFDSDKHIVAFGGTYDLGALFLPVGTSLYLTAAGQIMVYTGRTTAGYDHSGQVISTTFGAEFKY